MDKVQIHVHGGKCALLDLSTSPTFTQIFVLLYMYYNINCYCTMKYNINHIKTWMVVINVVNIK